MPDVIRELDKFMSQRPSSYVRLMFEHASGLQREDEVMFGCEPAADFVEKQIRLQHPFIRDYDTEKAWLEFYPKFAMMSRECMAQSLRNVAR